MVIAVDGHDGSGKTSLTRLLAARFGGRAVRPFADALGDTIAYLLRKGRSVEGSALAQIGIERLLDEHEDERVLWCDRHWASILVDLPRELHALWLPLPPTVICWVSPETTIERLRARSEAPGDVATTYRYCTEFLALADEHGVPVLDTTARSPESAADDVADLLRGKGVLDSLRDSSRNVEVQCEARRTSNE